MSLTDKAVLQQVFNIAVQREHERDQLAAALRSVIEEHDRNMAAVITPELRRRCGDPPALAEARALLTRLGE